MIRAVAYLCIWSTPFQVLLILRGIYIVAISDYSLFALSNFEFITIQLTFLLTVIDWMYTWIPKNLLDSSLSLPIILHQTVKAFVSTLLGIWLLRKTGKAI
jgi:hypothetical protein